MLHYGMLHPKLILFGEYSVLINGKALTIPLEKFSARLNFLDQANDIESARISNHQLKLFFDFIKANKDLESQLLLADLKRDLNDGLYLESDVPHGYGLGSSGLVCASLYRTYQTNGVTNGLPEQNYLKLRNNLGLMESYFHGKSSGIDPLSCYYGKPLLFTEREIDFVNIVSYPNEKWFLVDTGYMRKTHTLVKDFLGKTDESGYKSELELNYIPVVEQLIHVKTNASETDEIRPANTVAILMEALSNLQLRYFEAMIPCELLALWQNGPDSGKYYLKLLGAGGGGYLLGYTHDFEFVKDLFENCGFKVIEI